VGEFGVVRRRMEAHFAGTIELGAAGVGHYASAYVCAVRRQHTGVHSRYNFSAPPYMDQGTAHRTPHVQIRPFAL